jgi:hexulose-6-phosphate isomerase
MADALNRRHFLKLGGGVLATAALGSAGAAADKRRSIKKAIMYATIGFRGSIMEKFQAVKAAGFEGVEPMSHLNQDDVLKALQETGLKAASVCCATHWNKTLSDPSDRVREEAREGVIQALKDAKRYGATSVLLVPGDCRKGVTYDDCFKRSVAEIRKITPVAGDLGVKLAIENVWNDFITKQEQALEFLAAIDSPHVGWHFDIGNIIRYGSPEEWIRALGKRILKLHIKEYSKISGFRVRLLEGDDKWPAIMKALDEVGYDGWGISEQPGTQTADAAGLKDLSERMDKVFAS